MSDISSTPRTIHEWEQELGDAFRQLRLDAGYGQTELAERANLSRSSVQALERGSGTRLATVLSILRALDRLDVFDSIMRDDEPSPLEALAEAKRKATPRRNRKARS